MPVATEFPSTVAYFLLASAAALSIRLLAQPSPQTPADFDVRQVAMTQQNAQIVKEGFFTARDGAEIYWKTIKPTRPITGVVVFVHGLGDHSHRYSQVWKELTDSGFMVKTCDLRGHGRTWENSQNGKTKSMKKGDIHSMGTVFDDLIMLVTSVEAAEHIKAPLVIFGHSMGGLIALSLVHKHAAQIPEFRGVIASAPAIAPFYCPTWAYVASKTIAPLMRWFQDSNKLELKYLSRNEDSIKQYSADPLVHDKITLGTATDCINFGEKLLANAPQFTAPILMTFGTGDRFTSFPAGEKFLKAAGSTDKTFKVYEGFYHELHNEPERAEVIANYVDWIKKHTS